MDNAAQAYPQQMQRLVGSVVHIETRVALAAVPWDRIRTGALRPQAVKAVPSSQQSGVSQARQPLQGEAA